MCETALSRNVVVINKHPLPHKEPIMFPSTSTQFHTRTIGWSTVVASVAALAFTASAHAGSASDKEQFESPFSRPCFMVHSQWNEGIDGPQPTCPGAERAVTPGHDYHEAAPDHGFTRRHW